MNSLLEQVKTAEQDFEWYPTTREIIETICADITDSGSLLDIGAGNGNVFTLIDEIKPGTIHEKFAIEKSEMLVNAMDKDIFVIGTDFHQQTLIDKEVDYIFCNPPYSEYNQWAAKIISEANCQCLYLVIPDRWKENRDIADALSRRRVDAEILGSFSFHDSEYRKARTFVHVLKIRMQYERWQEGDSAEDPFDLWFDTVFTFDADSHDTSGYNETEKKKQEIFELATGGNVIQTLADCYDADLEKLHENYKAVERLDRDILRELSVNVNGLRSGLKQKIKGLKKLYWQELFDRLDTITEKLTSKSRERMLEKLTRHTSIDFTVKNAYAVVIWAVKNANHYIDEQLLDVYLSMTSKENITGYKSNKRFLTDEWRYLSDWDYRQKIHGGEVTHYALDYRLVFDRCRSNFNSDTFGDYDYPNGLRKDSHTFINDIMTVAQNLGFRVQETTFDLGEWSPGEKMYFHHLEDGKLVQFAEIKAYKNGNIHAKLHQKFMKQLNIEAGRLNGWLRTPQEANDELGIDDAEEHFKTNLQLIPEEARLLLTGGKGAA